MATWLPRGSSERQATSPSQGQDDSVNETPTPSVLLPDQLCLGLNDLSGSWHSQPFCSSPGKGGSTISLQRCPMTAPLSPDTQMLMLKPVSPMTLGVSVESHIVFQLGGKIQIAFHPVPLQLCPATCYIPPPPPRHQA